MPKKEISRFEVGKSYTNFSLSYLMTVTKRTKDRITFILSNPQNPAGLPGTPEQNAKIIKGKQAEIAVLPCLIGVSALDEV